MHVSLVLIIAAAALSSTQTIDSLPACGQQCISGVKAESSSLGCPNGELKCLCGIANYNFGIRDCAIQNCGADIASTVTNAASAECAAATGGAPANTELPATPPASTTAVPTTSAPPPPESNLSTAPAPTTTAPAASVAPTVTTSSSSTATNPSGFTTSVSSTSSNKSVASGGADGGVFAPTSSASGTTSSTTKASSSATTAASSDTAGTSSAAASTLSLGAKAGIGIGAAAAASAVIAFAVCMVVRKRQKRQNTTYLTSLKISDPLPGSGRSYANDHHHAQYETGLSDLETKSRRYEDMVPRTKPRHMV